MECTRQGTQRGREVARGLPGQCGQAMPEAGASKEPHLLDADQGEGQPAQSGQPSCRLLGCEDLYTPAGHVLKGSASSTWSPEAHRTWLAEFSHLSQESGRVVGLGETVRRVTCDSMRFSPNTLSA